MSNMVFRIWYGVGGWGSNPHPARKLDAMWENPIRYRSVVSVRSIGAGG
jgi:hypothetical protein